MLLCSLNIEAPLCLDPSAHCEESIQKKYFKKIKNQPASLLTARLIVGNCFLGKVSGVPIYRLIEPVSYYFTIILIILIIYYYFSKKIRLLLTIILDIGK